MTETIGSEEQIVGLVAPGAVVDLYKDYLVLYTGIKGIFYFCGIKREDTVIAGYSCTLELLRSPVKSVGQIAAEDIESDLCL